LTAIVLVGGMGTRLQSIVSDVPKAMALIDNKPFLEYLLKFLSGYGVTCAILSVGYKGEIIEDYFGDSFLGMSLDYSKETTPLGTGGAIKLALEKCIDNTILALNGDSIFNIDIRRLFEFHLKNNADITLSLKEMFNVWRSGIIKLNDNRVIEMREKAKAEHAYINSGTYILKRDVFSDFSLPERFSFEEFLTDNVGNLNISGLPFDANFIDIGIPEDYEKAQTLIPEWVKL